MVKRSYLILLLVGFVFVSLLTGCGTAQPGAGTAAQPDASQTEGTASAVSTDNKNGKYSATIDVEFIRASDDIIEQNIVQLKEKTGETIDDNRWIRALRDELGINVKYRWIAIGEQYKQKFKMTMASNDLPDVFVVPDLTDIKELAESGMIEEVGQYYNQYASDLLKSIVEADGKNAFDAVTVKGKTYAMPLLQPSLDPYYYFWIRSDWLSKLGLQPPKTMADLQNVMKAFVENNPDGRTDAIGLMVDKDFWTNKGFFWGYHAYPETWIEGDNGKLEYGAIQPEMKNALQALQQMYKDDLIDREFGVKDDSKVMESVISGSCGILYGGHWVPFYFENMLNTIPDADWISTPLPSVDNQPVKAPLSPYTDIDFVCIKKGSKNPEALIKIFNLFVDKIFSEDANFDYWYSDYSTIDNVWKMAPIYILHPHQNLNAYRDIQAALKNNTTDQLKGTARGYYANMQGEGGYAWKKMFGEGDTPFKVIEQVVSNKNYFMNKFMGSPTDTMVDKMSTLDELRISYSTKITLGELDAEAGFNQFVEQWKKLGGEKITEEVNAWYQEMKK